MKQVYFAASGLRPDVTSVNGDPYFFAVPTLHRERGFRFAFFERGYSKRQREAILDITTTHRQEWIRAWRGFFG